MPTLIIANGDLPESIKMPTWLATAEQIVAVDGGANHCFRLGIRPHILIGDLDSIAPPVLREYQDKGIIIHRHPPQKDATDLELAIDLASSSGTEEIWLLGCLGGRWDMSLANILLLTADKYEKIRFTLMGADCLMHLLRPAIPFELDTAFGTQVSFLPLRGDVHDLTLQGFAYPLKDAILRFGSSQGISNVIVEPAATVQFSSGLLLCVRLSGK